jgi:hypothetical protein
LWATAPTCTTQQNSAKALVQVARTLWLFELSATRRVAAELSHPIHPHRAEFSLDVTGGLWADHDFPIHQLIAEAAASWRFDGIATAVGIAVHQMSTQYTHMRLVHLCDQAMGLEKKLGVDAMGAPGVEDPTE